MSDSLNAEIAVLGSALVERESLDKMLSCLREEDFSLPYHRVMYRKMAEMHGKGEPADVITVPAAINGEGRLFPDGNAQAYAFKLTDIVPSALHVEHYAGVMLRANAEQRVKDACKKAAENPGDPDALKALVEAASQVKAGLGKRLKAAVQSVDKLLKEPDALTDWLIKFVWALGRGFVAGNPGVGKTWFCLQMALCIATGRPFLGKFNVKKGPVLFISEEEDRDNLKKKIRLLARSMGISGNELSGLHHITSASVRFPQNTDEIVSIVKELGCVAVFVDALRRVHTGNENSSTELQPVLDSLGRIKTDTGASVVVIHHLNKPSEGNKGKSVFSRMRGSSDLWAWRDCIVALEETDDDNVCKVNFQFRDAPESPSFDLCRAYDSEAGTVTLSFQEDQEMKDIEAEVYEIIRLSLSPMSGSKVAKAVGKKKDRVLKSIKRLNESGRIKFDQDNKGWVINTDEFAAFGSQDSGTGGNQ